MISHDKIKHFPIPVTSYQCFVTQYRNQWTLLWKLLKPSVYIFTQHANILVPITFHMKQQFSDFLKV